MIKGKKDQVYDIQYRAWDGLRVQNVGASSRSEAKNKAIVELGIEARTIISVELVRW